MGTAITGLYFERPMILSRFNRLHFDEVWHFYDGDPFEVHLLFENGSSETVIMGWDWRRNHRFQWRVLTVWHDNDARLYAGLL